MAEATIVTILTIGGAANAVAVGSGSGSARLLYLWDSCLTKIEELGHIGCDVRCSHSDDASSFDLTRTRRNSDTPYGELAQRGCALQIDNWA